MFTRLGAVALVGIGAVSAAVIFGDTEPDQTNSRRISDQAADPLGPMLARCTELGEAATRDAGCRKTWMENRRRFLGQPMRMQNRPVQPPGSLVAPEPTTAKDAPKSGPGPILPPFNSDETGAR